jgi:probable rRNA maturation factor
LHAYGSNVFQLPFPIAAVPGSMAQALVIFNRQRKAAFDLPLVRAVAKKALPACRAEIRSSGAALAWLESIEITIVGDGAIAKIHDQFFGSPEPTDVITFPHGEILIGAGVVSRNAVRFGHSASEEASLCIVHGLLHLAGWSDQTEGQAKEMSLKQEQIFKTARRMVCSPEP